MRASVDAALAADIPEVRRAAAESPEAPVASSPAALQALAAAFDAAAQSDAKAGRVGDARLATAPRRAALFDALTDESSAVQPGPLHAAVRHELASFATGLEEDESQQRLLLLDESPGATTDPRPLAVLSFRIARKRLLVLAEVVLGRFLSSFGSRTL